jgi:hypothetical protein
MDKKSFITGVKASIAEILVRFRGELFPTIKRETVKQNGR